jgi:hypothetical protein
VEACTDRSVGPPDVIALLQSDPDGVRFHATILTGNKSGIGIDQLLLLGAVMREPIDEAADLYREMMPMRVDRIHRKFDRPVFGQ